MARTPIDAQSIPSAYYPALPLSAGSAAVSWTADDDPTDRYCNIIEGKTLVLAQNTDVSARAITFISATDKLNRTGDISAYSIPAGETHWFGLFKKEGWQHSGQLYIDVSNAKVVLAVLTMP